MSHEQKDSGYQGRGQRYDKVHYGGLGNRRMSVFALMEYLKKTAVPPTRAEGPVMAEKPRITEADQR